MSDTPETDKATIASGGDWSPVLRETCRRLERERDQWAAMCGRYKQERDEAREDLEFKRGLYKVQEEYLEAARKELTEAKNKLDEEIKWHHQTHAELIQAQCKLLDIEYDKLKS